MRVIDLFFPLGLHAAVRKHSEVQRGRVLDLRGQHRTSVRVHQCQGETRAGLHVIAKKVGFY